ncbi:MAG: PQQ-dependent sugar dehydrogenase [Chloroflexota bacterium]|nr:PQQ-dependent sugar dehydrogenase [Chloroflexota bacterium]
MPKLRPLVALILVPALLAACATPSDSGAGSPEASVQSPGPAGGASGGPLASGTGGEAPSAEGSMPVTSDDPPSLALETVAEGLSAPIGIASAPGGWLLVNEQAGQVVGVHPERGDRTTALDIRDRVLGEGERGLLGLVLHPDWPDDGRAFVHYSDRDGNTVLSEFRGGQEGDAAPSLDRASEMILLGVEQPFSNHNGGQLAFGPDGFLWLGLGDGGSGGDPEGNGQNPGSLLGSILRLDVTEPGGYAIPDDNPFADGSGGAPEVYLFGLRNPWRFSFDPETDALWIADVGQSAYEEVNRLDPVADAGANLGWNVMEASHCFGDAGCSADGLVLPVAEYGRDQGCSVTGGHVYRGSSVEGLAGWYVFSDYCEGHLFGVHFETDGSNLAPRILGETDQSISSFGTDGAGELYVTDIGGGLLSRIVAGG